jgi:type III restriction enzyme
LYHTLSQGGRPSGRKGLFYRGNERSAWWDDLRHQEGAKIKCGEKHFEEIATGDNPAKYIKATNVDDMLSHS